MKLPRRVRVGGVVYQVKKVRSIPGGCLGFCDQEKALITIKAGMSAAVTRSTFAHELTHAIIYETGIWYFLHHHCGWDDATKIDELIANNVGPTVLAVCEGLK